MFSFRWGQKWRKSSETFLFQITSLLAEFSFASGAWSQILSTSFSRRIPPVHVDRRCSFSRPPTLHTHVPSLVTISVRSWPPTPPPPCSLLFMIAHKLCKQANTTSSFCRHFALLSTTWNSLPGLLTLALALGWLRNDLWMLLVFMAPSTGPGTGSGEGSEFSSEARLDHSGWQCGEEKKNLIKLT